MSPCGGASAADTNLTHPGTPLPVPRDTKFTPTVADIELSDDDFNDKFDLKTTPPHTQAGIIKILEKL